MVEHLEITLQDLKNKKEYYNHIVQLLNISGSITLKDKDRIIEQSKKLNRSILEILKSEYAISEDEIANVIAKTYGFDLINLKQTNFLNNEKLLKTLPNKVVFLDNIVPFDIDDSTLKVAIADPGKLSLVKNLSSAVNKRKIIIYITTFTEIRTSIQKLHEKYYVESGNISEEIEEVRSKFLEEEEKELRAAMDNKEIDYVAKNIEDDKEDIVPVDGNKESTVFIVNKIISRAIKMNASDIHIEPYKTKARVRFRKDGTLEIQKDLENIKDSFLSIVARLKMMASLNINEKRKPQDGALEFSYKGRIVDLRLSVCPTAFGERVVMRILDKGAIQLDLETLSIPERELKLIKRAIEMPKGMALVTGPTGSGKTTTLYSCLARLNKPDVNILTAEDPIEYSFEGIGQVKVNAKIGLTFAEVLRSFLRQDPEVIMVGEIRDTETVEIAIKAALTGHFVLSTLHTNSAIETVTRLVDMGVESYILTSAIVMILAQRLIKKNCTNCLVDDDDLNLEELELMGFPLEEIQTINFKKGSGCEKCNKTGYKGRQGVYEVLTFNEKLKEAIISGANIQVLREIAKKTGFIDMQEHGRRLIKDGVMSIEEFKRVLMTEA